MKRLRWQLLIVILSLVAITVLLLRQDPISETFVDLPEPVSGGNYSEGLIGSFSRLNPLLDFNNPVDRDIDSLLYDSLIEFDDRGLPQPKLAESWGISRDGTVYYFSMRKDARWHDGAPVTSADVIFTINLLRNSELPFSEDLRSLWLDVEVNAVNEYTLQFKLPEAFSPFLDYLSFGLLPEHLLAELSVDELIDSSFNMNPIGNGPYRFDKLIGEEGEIKGVVLSAFENYFGAKPFIDEVYFYYFPDEQSALEAYQNGEIQAISRITSESLSTALEEETLRFYTSRMPEMSIILLNLDEPNSPFLGSSEIRKAMLAGINRQKIIDRILSGQSIIADGPIFPNTWAFYEGLGRIEYDPNYAVEVLKSEEYIIPAEGGETRYKGDLAFKFDLLHPADEHHTAIAEAIKEDWSKIGIEATLIPLPYDELIKDYLDTRLYQAALVDLNLANSPDPDPYPFWHQTQSSGGQNYSLWNDRQASEYLEQARIILDSDERRRLYRNFQVRFSQELPALPLFNPMYTYAVSEAIMGITIGPIFEPSDRFSAISDWFLFSSIATETSP